MYIHTNIKNYLLWSVRASVLSILFAVALFAPNNANATHVAGGDLYYECLGNGMYRIILEFRRDCFNGAVNAQFDDPASLGIYSPDGTLQNQLGDRGQIRIPFAAQDTLNEVLTSECSVEGEDVCIHRTTYIDTVFLPDNADGYIISYQRCCRNASLSNIIDPLLTGATYWAHITPRAMDLCNSSPSFKAWPPIYLCASEMTQFDHSAVDADGDSLVYRLCLPNSGASEPFPNPQPSNPPPYPNVTYLSPYSVANMMGTADLTIDPQTGLLSVNPSLVGQFLIGVCVDEYRDGELLSTVMRDFEFNVRICNKFVNADFSVDPNPICDGLSVNFENESDDGLYNWYFDYPEPSATSTDRNPSYTYDEPGLYEVVLITTSGECSDSLHRMIGVSVPGDPSASLAFDVAYCSGVAEVSLTGDSDSRQLLSTWEWLVDDGTSRDTLTGQDVIYNYSGSADELEVVLVLTGISGCSDEVRQTINVAGRSDVDVEIATSAFACGDQIVLDLEGTSDSDIQIWEWEITDGSILDSLSGQNASYIYNGNSNSLDITLIVQDADGCFQSVTSMINTTNLDRPTVDFTHSLHPCSDDIEITLLGEAGADVNVTAWSWVISDDQDTYTVTGPNPTFVYEGNDPDVDITLQVEVDGRCTEVLSQSVSLSPIDRVMVDFSHSVNPCSDNLEIVLDGSTDDPVANVTGWTWTITDSQGTYTTTGPNPTFVYTGNDPAVDIALEVELDGRCTEVTNQSVDLTEVDRVMVDFTFDITACTDNVEMTLSGNASDPSQVTGWAWTVTDGQNTYTYTGRDPFIIYNGSAQELDIVLQVELDGRCSEEIIKTIPAERVMLEFVSSQVFVCEGSSTSLLLNPDPTYTYTWTPTTYLDLSDPANPIVSPQSDLTYTVVASNGQCEVTGSVDVSLRQPEIMLISDQIAVCEGGSTYLIQNGNPNLDYSYSPTTGLNLLDPSNPIASPTSDITYTVTARDGDCEVSEQVSVVISDAREIDIIGNEVACNGRVTLQANVGPTETVEWFSDPNFLSSLGTTNPIDIPVNGQVTIYVEASGGSCGGKGSKVIRNEDFTVQLDINEGTSICQSETLQVQANSNLSSDDIIYTWSPTHIIERGQGSANPVFDFGVAGVYTISYVAESPAGCVVQGDTRVEVMRVPDPIVQDQVTVCAGARVGLNPNSNPDYQYQWSSNVAGLFSNPNAANPTVTVIQPTTVNVTITYQGQAACAITQAIELNTFDDVQFALEAEKNTVCAGETTQVSVNIAEDVDVTWRDESGFVVGTGKVIVVAPQTDQTYTATISSAEGCTAEASLRISIAPPLTLDIVGGNQEFCVGQMLNIEAITSVSANIVWMDQAGNILQNGSQYNFTTQEQTTVFATATDQFGCTAESFVTFTPVSFDPQIEVTESLICQGEVSIINVVGLDPERTYNIRWDGDNSILTDLDGASITVEPDQSTTYNVTITDADGCSASLSAFVAVSNFDADLEITASANNIVPGETVQLTSSLGPGFTYEWNPSAFLDDATVYNPIAFPSTEMTTYSVTVTDENGCTAEASIVITMNTAECDLENIFVPNMFTPNGDGVNDLFKVESNYIDDMEMIIYNRWGEEVFKSNAQDHCWDGTFNGTSLDPDVYGYYLRVTCINGSDYAKQGNVTIVK